jgi:hypothetical protein
MWDKGSKVVVVDGMIEKVMWVEQEEVCTRIMGNSKRLEEFSRTKEEKVEAGLWIVSGTKMMKTTRKKMRKAKGKVW